MALANQDLDQLRDRALPQIIGAWLEAQSKHGNLLLAGLLDQPVRLLDLVGVAFQNRPQYRRLQIQFLRLVEQSPQVLRQTRPAEGETGLQIGRRDIEFFIAAKYFHHLPAVETEPLGDVAHLVGERNLQSVIGVSRILDHLRDAQLRPDDRCRYSCIELYDDVTTAGVELP